MKSNQLQFEAKICLYNGQTQWHYVLLPKEIAEKVQHQLGKTKKKNEAIRVEVTVEDTTWNTKLFDHKESKSYLLPLSANPKSKSKVGDTIQVALTVLG